LHQTDCALLGNGARIETWFDNDDRTDQRCMVGAFAAPVMTPSYCAERASQSMDFPLGTAVAASIGVAIRNW
jgi:hypothetical protein